MRSFVRRVVSRVVAIESHVLLALAISSGCATLPVPTPKDAERVQSTVESLSAGRSIYLSRCGSCHQTHQPSRFAPDAWPKLVGEMRARAKLTPEDQSRILEYLITMSTADSTTAVR